jgi:hypothetical protein
MSRTEYQGVAIQPCYLEIMTNQIRGKEMATEGQEDDGFCFITNLVQLPYSLNSVQI